MTLRPRDLPKRRNQLLKHLTDPHAAIRANTGDDNEPGLAALARHIRAAELYWVTADMAPLAVAAGAQLTEVDYTVDSRPAGCGLMAFDGEIGALPLPQGGVPVIGGPGWVPMQELPVAALSWGPYPQGTLVWAFMHRSRFAVAVKAAEAELLTDQMPPLIPTKAVVIPDTSPTPVSELDATIPATIQQALAAAWLLMQQPNLVDRSQVRPDKSVRATTQRLGMTDPEVTLVDLRRQYVPDDRDETGTSEGRRYRHRWVVSGHWRDQAHGPERSLRRKTWIAAYVKGPDGAPLLRTEKVNVWRR